MAPYVVIASDHGRIVSTAPASSIERARALKANYQRAGLRARIVRRRVRT